MSAPADVSSAPGARRWRGGALAALALVTGVWVGLHTYELVRWREARAESRSLLTS